jgi:hypothetical protein
MPTAVQKSYVNKLVTTLTEHEFTTAGATVLTLSTTAKYLRFITVDNAAEGAAAYLKLWDWADLPVHGTDAPDWEIKIPNGFQGNIMVASLPSDANDGIQFALGVYAAVGLASGLTATDLSVGLDFTVGLI